MKNIRLINPIRSHTDRLEFKIVKTTVWVQIPPVDKRPWRYLRWCQKRANLIIEEVWDDIPRALDVAAQASEEELPQFWQDYRETRTIVHPFAVHEISIDPNEQIAVYTVYRNPDYMEGVADFPVLPKLYNLSVARSVDGELFALSQSE